MDRVGNEGIIALLQTILLLIAELLMVFAKPFQEEFDYCYIIDTKSDVRANPKIAGTTHNVFGIQTGVAVMFLVKCKE